MPQQIGPAASSEFTHALYYAPPPQQPPNIFAAFWSGFLRERTPWAREVFTARLRAMDPSAKLNAMVELEKQLTERQKSRDAAIKSAMSSGGNLAAEIVRSETNLAMKGADAAMANLRADVDIRGQQTQLGDAQMALLKEIQPVLDDLKGSIESGDAAKQQEAMRSIEQLNKQAYATTSKLTERQAWDRIMGGKMNTTLATDDPAGADLVLDVRRATGMSDKDEPLQEIGRAGVDRGAVSKGLDTAISYGVPLGGSSSVSVSGKVPEGGTAAPQGGAGAPGGQAPQGGRAAGAMVGLLQALQAAYPEAPPLSFTRADIEWAADPKNTGLGAIGDPIHLREKKGTQRKREAFEGASEPAKMSLGMAAGAVAEDPLADFLPKGKKVVEQTRATAEQLAGAEKEHQEFGGGYTPPSGRLRPTEEDEQFAAALDPESEVTTEEPPPEDDDLEDFMDEELVKAKRRLPSVGFDDGTVNVSVPLPRLRKKKKQDG